jgi:hypothetical protein
VQQQWMIRPDDTGALSQQDLQNGLEDLLGILYRLGGAAQIGVQMVDVEGERIPVGAVVTYLPIAPVAEEHPDVKPGPETDRPHKDAPKKDPVPHEHPQEAGGDGDERVGPPGTDTTGEDFNAPVMDTPLEAGGSSTGLGMRVIGNRVVMTDSDGRVLSDAGAVGDAGQGTAREAPRELAPVADALLG